jgi:DNA-binding transcriptional LysR family regulator
MDVDLARTFLAVVETGSFFNAAKRVHVTQSTVSARIKTLEERLGKSLFDRRKSGATVSPAGAQFLPHAESMVRIWEHARLEVSLPAGYKGSIAVGAQYSLWESYLLQWLANMRTEHPEIAVRAQVGISETLMSSLINSTIDLAVMYTPQRRPGFEVTRLFEDKLVLVSANPESEIVPSANYVFIDWGPEFRADHALNFPEIVTPGTYLEIGSLSLKYLINTQSSGYVPERLLIATSVEGQLRTVKDAPSFSYPAYAVYPTEGDNDLIQMAVAQLMRGLH